MKAVTTILTFLPLILPTAHALNRVSISGIMDITDDETFGSDEHATRRRNFDTIFVGDPLPATTTFDWTERMGGEVRIELVCSATAQSSGAVAVSCQAKLFEGTSTGSNDLDGTGTGSGVVAVGASQVVAVDVKNTDEGGDHAEIRLTVSNTRA
jgi:hypothetical protein